MLTAMKALGCSWMTAARYADLDSARRAAAGFSDVRQVVMGCDGLFWVVSSKDAGKLRKAGYETI